MKSPCILRSFSISILAIAVLAVPAASDQCIIDDLIVDGSQCIGFDCVCNSESFGFDTLRLKENNLRVHFLDTSTVPSFPDNDWRIIINDSANGGGEYFAIEDASAGRQSFRVEAGARSNALHVDSSGNIGIGTSTPSADLHVITGDTPTLRLQQDGSSGFEPQTWDIAGNETNFFVRDVTTGSTLPLRIRPGAPTNALAISQPEGNVGIGTVTPSQALHIRRTSSAAGLFVEDAQAAQGGRALLTLSNAGTTRFDIINRNGAEWRFQSSQGSNNFLIDDPAVVGAEFELDNDGDLTIAGDLVTGGAGNCAPPNPACDDVFSSGYELESIAEHAELMWRNSHLPAVGPNPANQPINLTRTAQGMLNELEKAHIYIEQLQRELTRLSGQVAELERARREAEAAR